MSGRPSVLIVDDDPDIREAVADALADEGYPVDVATNGREALELLIQGQTTPGVILLDLMMPELDGWGFMAEVGKLPELAAIPIIVFSAQAASTDLASLRISGFLRKPLGLEDLLELVGRCARAPASYD